MLKNIYIYLTLKQDLFAVEKKVKTCLALVCPTVLRSCAENVPSMIPYNIECCTISFSWSFWVPRRSS